VLILVESDEEILPEKSRFFTRIAVGMYHDLRFKALERQERTSRDPRIGPGTALFVRLHFLAVLLFHSRSLTVKDAL